MVNFIVRFFYQMFFEIMICALINISYKREGDGIGFAISYALIIVSILLIILIGMTIWRSGPKHYGVYERGTCSTIFWGYRPLKPELLVKHKDLFKSREFDANS